MKQEIEMNMANAREREQGFSLLEIMVVLIIIGVMAAIVAPNFIGQSDDAKVEATKVQMDNIASALKLYRLKNNHYPDSASGLAALVNDPNGKKYLDDIPKDAWGNDFVYLAPGVHGDFDILSYGADGKSGGSGYDADIGNWER